MWVYMATYTVTPCSNYDDNVIDSLYAFICNISDTDFMDNEVTFDISMLSASRILCQT